MSEDVRQKILSGKGTLLDSFSRANELFLNSSEFRKPSATTQAQWHSYQQLPSSQSPFQVLCLSHSYCLTSKFIQCLTVGIPIISYKWIADCIEQVNYIFLSIKGWFPTTGPRPAGDCISGPRKIPAVLWGHSTYIMRALPHVGLPISGRCASPHHHGPLTPPAPHDARPLNLTLKVVGLPATALPDYPSFQN